MTEDGVTMNSASAMQTFIGAEAEHQLAHRRIGGEALALGHGLDESGGRQHLEALVDADQKFGRNDQALDGAELHALGLPLYRAQLARRIDLGLDAAAGILLDRGGVVFRVLMRRVVERRQRYLHHKGLVVRRARAGRQECRHDENDSGKSRRG